MRKLLYAIFSIVIFTACNFNVQADEFNIENCKNSCENFGDKNYCLAACDAEKLIKDKQALCQDENCKDRWQDAFYIKLEYYYEYYNNKTADGSFNYSRFDLVNCQRSCEGAGDFNSCNNSCLARQKVKECIVTAYTSEQVINCKNNFDKFLQNPSAGNPSSSIETKFNYETCKKQCTSSNMNECESDCYAKNKIEECKKDCHDGSCAMGCEAGYDYYYNQRLNTYNPYSKVQCGDFDIPYAIPQIVRTIIVILQIATPIIIIVFGSIDLLKAVMAQKDDDIKKGQKTFLRRLLIGALVFLTFFIVEFIIGFFAPKKDNYNMWNCIDCFVNGDCKTK